MRVHHTEIIHDSLFGRHNLWHLRDLWKQKHHVDPFIQSLQVCLLWVIAILSFLQAILVAGLVLIVPTSDLNKSANVSIILIVFLVQCLFWLTAVLLTRWEGSKLPKINKPLAILLTHAKYDIVRIQPLTAEALRELADTLLRNLAEQRRDISRTAPHPVLLEQDGIQQQLQELHEACLMLGIAKENLEVYHKAPGLKVVASG